VEKLKGRRPLGKPGYRWEDDNNNNKNKIIINGS